LENCVPRWIFSHEATFYVLGRINRHNCRTWVSGNLDTIPEIERGSAKAKFGVLCYVRKFLGPLFFADHSVTAMIYLVILQLYQLPQMEDGVPAG
jgi:hypothetical protein